MKPRIMLTKRPFIRNVLIVASGTAAAQAVRIALSPIITRLYGPESFGLLGVFTAIVGIIGPISALAYPIAIVLPKENREARGLLRLSVYISFFIATSTLLLLLLLNNQIAIAFRIVDIAPFLFLIPLVIVFSGLLQVAEQWLIRTQQFGVTAKVTIIQAIILQGGQVGIGLFHPSALVLIISSVLGQGLKALMMIVGARRSLYTESENSCKETASTINLAKKYKDFPIYRAPEISISAVSQSLPILLLTSFFGPASAGFYSIGKTVLNLPTQLIGKAVGDVFYSRISGAANNNENLSRPIGKATLVLGAIGILPYGLVIALGPWLFSFVFGTAWTPAGEYARWIALWSLFGFMNRPSVVALPVLSAQAFHLKYTVFMLIVRVVVLAVGYYVFDSDLVAVALFCVSGALL
ncbi:MAG: oligosaccharide flippase family protein, partial [Clostridiales bacterium]|nr:oligosaccharide flippase family protein [Clostridiales bacterium]